MEASSQRPPVSVDSKYYTHTYYDTHLSYAGCDASPSLLGALGLRLQDNEVVREDVLGPDSLLCISRPLINALLGGFDRDHYGLKEVHVSIENKMKN
jgi:hypothetical protein